jgi:hypothetical protein
MKKIATILYISTIMLVSSQTKATETERNVSVCIAEDKSAQFELLRSDANHTKRALYKITDNQKELIWENERKDGFGIATNRGIAHRIKSAEILDIYMKNRNTGVYDGMPAGYTQGLEADNQPFQKPEPDPYELMELVKVACKDDVIVMIVRTKCKLTPQRTLCYAGGFFYDQANKNLRENDLFLPPYITNGYFPLLNSDYRAPWDHEHGSYEYFMRSFVRGENGKWQVHVSAAISVLWADSLGLPMKSLEIEDRDTYAVTFEGKYQYCTLHCRDLIADLHANYINDVKKSKGYSELTPPRVILFDTYGDVEKLVYRKKLIGGVTVEKIKFERPVENNTSGRVLTTLHGGETLVTVGYDDFKAKKYWQGADELSDEEVKRPQYQITMMDQPTKLDFAFIPAFYIPLPENAVRQTYTLKLDEALKQVDQNIKFLTRGSTSEDLLKYDAKSVANNWYWLVDMKFMVDRLNIYKQKIEEALKNNNE